MVWKLDMKNDINKTHNGDSNNYLSKKDNINKNTKRTINAAAVVVVGIIFVLCMGFSQISILNTNAQNIPQPNVNPNNVTMAPIIMHIHPKINVTIDGNKQVIPSDIGISPELWKDHSLDRYGMQAMPEMSMAGMAPLHTHDETGIIHVESTINRNYTLGEFLNIWGSLNTYNTLVNMTIDGKPDSDGNFTSHVLRDGEQISLDLT